ncbi:hypothetical protein D3C80_843620 [compost metagenome]
MGNGVQFLTGRMATFLQLGVVVTEADDQLGVADQGFVRVHPVASDPLQGWNVISLTVRRRQQVGVARLQAHHRDMAVGIKEAGQQGAPIQIDHLGAPARLGAGGVQ